MHFPVAVITKGEPTDAELSALLAPYEEDAADEFMEFVDATDEYRDNYENDVCRHSDSKADGLPYKDLYTFRGYCLMAELADERDGRFGYMRNPNAKWDWWAVGGRWNNNLALRDGSRANTAPILAIDLSLKKEAYEAAMRAFEKRSADGKLDFSEPFAWELNSRSFPKWKDADDFARAATWGGFFFVVTPDGAWHECAETWRIYAPEAREWREGFAARFLEPYRDCFLTVVDCHI